jgi:hypothetical protein
MYSTWSMLRTTVGWVLLALFLGMVGLWTLFGFRPDLIEQVHGPLTALGQVSEWWPILAGAITGGGAAWTLAPTLGLRGGDEDQSEGGVSLRPWAAAILGLSSLLMMYSAYWPCSGDEAPLWSSLRHAAEAFEGYVAEPFGTEQGACPRDFPQTLMAGVLFSRTALVLVAALALTHIFRDSIEGLRARRARQIVVFAGVSDETPELIRSVAANLTNRQTLLLLDPGPELSRARELARDISRSRTRQMESPGASKPGTQRGARTIARPIDVSDVDAITTFMRGRKVGTLVGLYLMSPDTGVNLKAMRAFLDAATDRKPEWPDRPRQISRGPRWWRLAVRTVRPLPSEVPGRVVVRIDNPWHADDWRRRQSNERIAGGWLFDALSATTAAARHAIHHVRQPVLTATAPAYIESLVIEGASQFDLALLTELAFEHRVFQTLNAAAQSGYGAAEWHRQFPSAPPNVQLVGAAAQHAGEYFRQQLSRYNVTIDSDLIRETDSRQQAMSSGRAALVLPQPDATGRPESDATFVAAANPTWRILAWSKDSRGITEEALLGDLYLVGPTLEPAPGYGVDLWERLGRINHQLYRVRYLSTLDQELAAPAARGDWDRDLSSFTRESNVRTFAAFAHELSLVGGTWAVSPPNSGESEPLDLAGDALERFAESEHQSWVRHHAEYGWTNGNRDDANLTHNTMVPWEQLDGLPGDSDWKERDRSAVRDAADLFAAIGFQAVVPSEPS